ncbi:MAG: tRNA preQ1(34) S-adenosylmethionine ribosyltransferase-isomerase QueA [Desulfobacteraceae bacterium]|nr:tRNA preQ1(34) S-adenosylmethionine ribosyltransferase-isomerase QueA [Desulfobacteraceae bacterium]
MYRLEDYNYHLPESMIAQHPVARRDKSRLLHLDRRSGAITHLAFDGIYDLIDPGDVLVVNNTEVVPGRLTGRKTTGGKVEVLILDYYRRTTGSKPSEELLFQCLIKASKRPKPGTSILFDESLSAEVLGFDEGVFTVAFHCDQDFDRILAHIGNLPLPHYIRRDGENEEPRDRTAYQTVYAQNKGAIAAPTAGLHFTRGLIRRLKAKGVGWAAITLHVGYGTFVPVRVDDIREHKMHAEYYSIGRDAADTINNAVGRGGRLIAVGTTSVRTLEHAADDNGVIAPGSGHSDIFIYPGYRFKAIDAMITNFHLPKSTLLMLVSAFSGREKILSAYAHAVEKHYRFFSYGDAMLMT